MRLVLEVTFFYPKLLGVRFQINPDIFSASYDGASMTYDAYERDIALVTFYFDTDTVFEYSRYRHLINHHA